MKIGFIGAGNMGSALAKAAAKSGSEIYISDIDSQKAENVAKELSAKASTSEEISAICDYVFLAVKPKFITSVIEEIKPSLKADSTIVSMAAGVTIAAIEAAAGKERRIIRIMPNTPASVGEGVILTSANSAAKGQLAEFCELMKGAGLTEPIEEELIDAGTALSGCSPAFVYMFIDALAKGGEAVGLPHELAVKHAAQTALGAAALALSSDKTPAELRDAVCSPGGATIEGVRALNNDGLEGSIMNAILASYKRTKELGK